MSTRCTRAGWIVVLLGAVIAGGPRAAAEDDRSEAEDVAIREQTIYVPYSKLRKVFEQQGRGVFLPYEQFQELWKQARAAAVRQPDRKPPIEALITEIQSTATVGDEVIEVSAHLTIEVLTEGWHEVPLRLADAAILSARLDDQPARIVSRPKIGYVLLIHSQAERPEPLRLALRYTKAFTKTPGQNRVSFQAPQAPVNRWEIHIPESGVKVEVQPMIAATEIPSSAEPNRAAETVVQAFVGAAPTMSIQWTPKAEGATGLAVLASVRAHQQVMIDQGVVRTRAQLAYKISRAELAQLSIETPADHRVLNVVDPNVKEWTVNEANGRNRISVQLYEPARDAQNITVELERFSDALLEKPVPIPVIQALGVGQQQGVLVVHVAPSLRAEAVARSGLVQVDAAELPAPLAKGRWDFSYRYASLPFELSLRVEKLQPQIHARELVEAYLEPERLTIDLLALYEIERAGVFQLALDVPPGFEVRQVRGRAAAGAAAASVESHHLEGEAKKRLVVNLARKAEGRVGLFVELFQRLDDPNLLAPTGHMSNLALPLPRVAPEGVEQSTGRLIVYAPESLRVHPSTQKGVRSISLSEALEGSASMRDGRFPKSREVLVFAYTRQPVDLVLGVGRRKPFITARQLLVARIQSGVIQYEATLDYDIRYSSVKQLRLDVPAELAGRIRNDTTAVVRDARLDPQPDDVADGCVAWSLTGESELLGNVTVQFSWEKKIDELAIGGSMEQPERLPRLIPRGVDRAWGQIVIAKAETLDVRVAGEPVGLRPIDPQHDLMPGVRVDDAARAFEFHDAWELAVTATRYALIDVKRTSIERAVVRMEVTRSDQISVQALYRMRSARQRLAIALPAEVKFDTEPLRINGRPVSLERGEAAKNEYYIPLAGQNPEAPFLLELRYTMPGDYRRLDLPEFPGQPAIQKVYLCVYLPRELALLGARGPWTDERAWRWYEALGARACARPTGRDARGAPSTDTELVAWVIAGLGAPNPAQDFVTDGRLHTFSTLQPAPPPAGSLHLVAIDRTVFDSAIFVVVALLGLVVVRRPISNKLAAVALLVALLLTAGVFLPAFSRQILGGAFWSAVLVVAVLWAAWHVLRAWPVVVTAVARKRSVKAPEQAAEAASAEEPPESPEPSADASSGPEPSDEDADQAPTDDPQEGGRDHV